MIYLDNAASSWPKPAAVMKAMNHVLQEVGANPGRSGHRLSVEAARIIYAVRESIARLFNSTDPLRVIFCPNATEALNLALKGVLGAGDHVITGSMEHNSMMRPLRALESEGLELTVVPCSPEGYLDPGDVAKRLKRNTSLIAINHGSNVTGGVQPVDEIARMARGHGCLLLVDAAQTAGSIEVNVEREGIDLLAFTGHKGLFGPQGTGGLVIGENVRIENFRPLKTGGTGSRSEFEKQPEFLPDKYESGTHNTVGIAGLGAGVDFILSEGIHAVQARERELTGRLIQGLREIDGITLYPDRQRERQLAVVSFISNSLEPSELGLRLDRDYGILCRVGLHCSPSSHKTIGTFPKGTVRCSMGYFTTGEEVDSAVAAVRDIVG